MNKEKLKFLTILRRICGGDRSEVKSNVHSLSICELIFKALGNSVGKHLIALAVSINIPIREDVEVYGNVGELTSVISSTKHIAGTVFTELEVIAVSRVICRNSLERILSVRIAIIGHRLKSRVSACGVGAARAARSIVSAIVFSVIISQKMRFRNS